ncbi:hypothetical protein Tco_0667461 [Tanacetum coccineum]
MHLTAEKLPPTKTSRSRPATANNNNNHNNNNPKAQGANTNATFFDDAPGHPGQLPPCKNKNQGNGNGVARAYAWEFAGKTQTITLGLDVSPNQQINADRLNIISCTKAQKYVLQGCHVFLAHITIKETGDQSKKKQLQDVPIVKNFPEHCTLAIGPIINEEGDQLQELSDKLIRPILTMGSSSSIRQKERWIVTDVHRLSRTKQTNGEEPLSATIIDELD